jgi:hypothetical protein
MSPIFTADMSSSSGGDKVLVAEWKNDMIFNQQRGDVRVAASLVEGATNIYSRRSPDR